LIKQIYARFYKSAQEAWNRSFTPVIPVKLMHTEDQIYLPVRKLTGDAGADLRARLDSPKILLPNHKELIPTGIALEIPPGYVGDVRPRSGAAKDGKVAIYGTIDSNYRGEIHVNVENRSNGLVSIEPMERIAQLVIIPYLAVDFELVSELSQSERGSQGFGSTGRF
jgi:dUTP pyrophosphatase